jgi:hypothetical protein
MEHHIQEMNITEQSWPWAAAAHNWPVTSDSLAGQGLQRGRLGCKEQQQQCPDDPRIIRKLGEERRRVAEAWRRTGMEMRGRKTKETYPRLEAEATTWRGSARATVAAASPGRTPALHRRNERIAHHPGDNGTDTAEAAPMPGQSQEGASIDDEVHSSPETTNRRRRFASRSGRVAILRKRKDSMKPCGTIDRSSHGGSGGAGGVTRGRGSWPERGGGHGGDTIAT